MGALEFQINLSGNFAAALEGANKGLDHTGEGAKKAAKEIELFETEVGGLSTSLGGLGFNLSAISKGGSLFTFDLAEGLRSVVELGSKVVETFIDIGKEAVGVGGKTQDIDLAFKLNVGDEKAEKLNQLAEVYGEKSRFSAMQMKESWLPLLRQGIGDTNLIDTVSTIATDMAAKSGGGIGQVRQTIDAFASVFQRGKLKEAGLEQMGLRANDFFDEVGKQMGMTRDAARKAARAGKLPTDDLARIAATMFAERQGGHLADPTKAAAANLGGTLERLHNLKDSMFEGIANSPGMTSIKGFLDNLITTVKGPVGRDLFKTISDSFVGLFGDLSGPEGLKKVEAGFKDIAGAAKGFIGEVNSHLPEIKAVIGSIVHGVEELPGILHKVGIELEVLATIWAGKQLAGLVAGFAEALPALGVAAGLLVSPFGLAAIAIGGLVAGILALHHQFADTTAMIDSYNKAHPVDADAAKYFGTEYARSHKATVRHGGMQIGDLGTVGEMPQYASGGIVGRPTIALIGEAGPEAIVPLSSSRGSLSDILEAGGSSSLGGRQVAFSGDIVVNVHGVEGGAEEFGARAAQVVRVEFKRFLDELPV
jgi:tape measure domain-containing protein